MTNTKLVEFITTDAKYVEFVVQNRRFKIARPKAKESVIMVGEKLAEIIVEKNNGSFVFKEKEEGIYEIVYEQENINNFSYSVTEDEKIVFNVPIIDFESLNDVTMSRQNYLKFDGKWHRVIKLCRIGEGESKFSNTYSQQEFLALFYKEVFVYFIGSAVNCPYSILGSEMIWPYHPTEVCLHLY